MGEKELNVRKHEIVIELLKYSLAYDIEKDSPEGVEVSHEKAIEFARELKNQFSGKLNLSIRVAAIDLVQDDMFKWMDIEVDINLVEVL